MKIVVKKENGLLEVGQTYEADFDTIVKRWYITDVCLTREKFASWLSNGYIEEVKEVSYRFADIYEGEGMNLSGVATNKQFDQVLAYMKLTHVRAKILKDKADEIARETNPEIAYSVWYSKSLKKMQVYSFSTEAITSEFLLAFQIKEHAELALQHNQELFKTYLGV